MISPKDSCLNAHASYEFLTSITATSWCGLKHSMTFLSGVYGINVLASYAFPLSQGSNIKILEFASAYLLYKNASRQMISDLNDATEWYEEISLGLITV